MASAKTVVATGVSSGLGLEALKQLLLQPQPYTVILGARNTQATTAAVDAISFDKAAKSVTIYPLDLANLKTVQTFSQQVLGKLGSGKIDYLFLNAGLGKDASEPGPNGSKWCEALIVNHTSHHYLTHLLREKLVESKARIISVSSGGIRAVKDTSLLDTQLAAPSDATAAQIYCGSKFVQFLGAQWWRRELAGQCTVVAVSPGLIPGTGLGRHSLTKPDPNHPDAKSVAVGAASLLAAFTRDDFPADPDAMFLTSWGDWWGKEIYPLAVDRELQDKWSLSKEDIEREEGLSA